MTAGLEHAERRYEVSQDNRTIAEEYQELSPETRSCAQEQAVDLFSVAGSLTSGNGENR